MKQIINLGVRELADGYTRQGEIFCCNFCGMQFHDGEVYPSGGRYLRAETRMRGHIREEHGDMLSLLLGQEKKYVSLTDVQKELLTLIAMGWTDNQIAKEMDITAATVRRQRYTFREKAKQARLYLAIYETAFSAVQHTPGAPDIAVPVHPTATMVDARYDVSDKEQQAVLDTMFFSLHPLRLKTFPSKEKKKLVVLRKIAAEFVSEKHYTEQEVNEILHGIFDDYVTIRRYLIEYGFMARTKDCKEYWLL